MTDVKMLVKRLTRERDKARRDATSNEMAANAIDAIHELLDSGGIP